MGPKFIKIFSVSRHLWAQVDQLCVECLIIYIELDPKKSSRY